MEEVHQDKEPVPAARQPSKTNQPTNQSLLLVLDYQGTKYLQVLQVSASSKTCRSQDSNICLLVTGKQMTASRLCHSVTKQQCIKLICCRSFICDHNNCQVPARGFRNLIKAFLFEMDSCFS